MGREIRRKEAKKKNNKIKKVEKIDTSIKGSTLLKLIAICVFMIVLLYLVVAIFITKEIEVSWFNNNKTEETNEVLSNRILAKNTFNQKESTYYVYFYDYTDEVSSVSTSIRSISDKVYKVNTKDGFNSNYVSEETNKDASSIEELKVKALTLIKVVDGSIVEYYEGKEEINNNFGE